MAGSKESLIRELASTREKLKKAREVLSEVGEWMDEFALPNLEAHAATEGGHTLLVTVQLALQETEL